MSRMNHTEVTSRHPEDHFCADKTKEKVKKQMVEHDSPVVLSELQLVNNVYCHLVLYVHGACNNVVI